MVLGTIGNGSTRLIVDTGSSDHILTTEMAERWALRPSPAR